MHHGSMTGESLVNSMPYSESNQCVDYHLGLLQTLCQSTPQATSIEISTLLIAAFGLIGLIGITLNFDLINRAILFKLQKLKPNSLLAFMAQIGNWLTLIQQKVPSYAFANA